eukprot:4599546-Amphidinium_carterae.1
MAQGSSWKSVSAVVLARLARTVLSWKSYKNKVFPWLVPNHEYPDRAFNGREPNVIGNVF